MKITKAFVALVAVVAFMATFSVFSYGQAGNEPRVTQQIDDSRVVRLFGNTRPEAMDPANDRGPLPDSYDLEHMLLVLQRSPEQQEDLDAFIDSLNDRNSPNFHKWLDAEEFGQKFGVAQEDIDKIVGWLEYHGFRINQVYPSHMMIDVSGSVGQVREAFGTQMHSLEVNGKPHIGNTNDPSIPAALSPVLKGVFSLHDFMPEPYFRTRPDYTFAGCTSSTTYPTEPGTCYSVTPQDNAVIYNLNPLWSAGYTGSGQTIAVIEDGDIYKTTDWSTYRTTFGLTSYPGTLTTVHPGSCTDPGDVTGVEGEVAIDVEVATGVAPGAAIKLSTCADTATTFGGLIALENIVNGASPYPNIVSISYGQCEVLTGSTGNLAFYNTYSLAATEGISVFVSTGDDGPNSCGNIFSASYNVAGLGITGWGETPYNVAVGGTDFEDYYNAKTGQNGGAALSTYWLSTNGTNDVSAKKYVPEMPWNNSCGDVLIAEEAKSTFTTYGSSGFCNEAPGNTGYLSTGAASGGASNCATGAGSNVTVSALPTCQGWSKPSYQTGSSLTGGQAVFGQPTDGVRDIPDVSMFAANGDWGHYETICWSDTGQSSAGGASCAGAPSTWSGFGGTSVATPSMAGVQALVNQYTGENWGNPLTYYYQIGQNEYGTAGGTFAGSACNSSTGSGTSCVWNDVTQGDIDTSCENDGTTEEAHCYYGNETVGTGHYGVSSTDVITGATVISGGTGYTSAPTCAIAGPSNNNPYKTPTGTTLWAGGTQATCTAAFNSGSQTNVWTIAIPNNPSGAWTSGGLGVVVGGTTYTFVTSLTAPNQVLIYTSSTATTNETNTAKNLEAAINATSAQCGSTAPCYGTGTVANASATATESTNTLTLTAKTAGYSGAFQVAYGASNDLVSYYISINQTTPGSGPGYVSGITIGTAGSGYGPETPVTLTGGAGSGAIAVANTTQGTAASTYQPTYGAAPGWDMATGLGTPNATNLACSSVWGAGSGAPCTISTTTAVSSNHNPSTFGQGVTWTATITPSAATGAVQFVVDSSNYGSPVTVSSGTASSTPSDTSLSVGSHTVTANFVGTGSYSNSTGTLSGGQTVSQASQTITVTTAPPSSAAYNSTFPVAATASSGLAVAITTSGSCSGSGTSSATITMTSGTGTCSVIFNQAGNTSYSAAPTVTDTVNATTASQTISWTTAPPASAAYNSSFNVAATATSGLPVSIAGSGVCSGSGSSGSATITMNSGSGTCTVTASQSGNTNYSAATSLTPTVNATPATSTTSVTSSLNPSTYGQSVSFTANVTSGATGTVQFYVDSTAFGSAVTLASGSATSGSISTLAVGTHTVTATYSGDSNYTGSTGTLAGGQVVQTAGAGTITVSLTSGTDPSTYGQSLTFTASIPGQYGQVKGRNGNTKAHPETVTGTVTWSANTGCAPSTVTPGTPGLATCTTSILPVGASDTVTANYSGDSNHSSGSGSVSQQVIQVSSSTGVSSSLNPSIYGQAVSFTANVTGSSPTGTVQFYVDSTAFGSAVTLASGSATSGSISTLAVGNHTVTATYSGDTNNTGSTGTLAGGQVVNTAGAGTITVSLTSGTDPSTYGQSLTFTASIPGQYGQVKGRKPNGKGGIKPEIVTGTVTWSANTGCAPSTVTPGTPGLATCTTSMLPVGASDTVTASYSGDSNHSSGSGSVSQQVIQASSSTGVSSSLNPSAYGQSINFTATVTGSSPTGTVQFYVDSALFDTETLSSGSATSASISTLAVGTHTVTATYSGDTNNTGSTGTLAGGQIVNTAGAGTITVGSSLNPSTYGQSVTFTASIPGQYGLVKGRKPGKNGIRPMIVTGSVTWNDANGPLTCTESGSSTTTVSSGNPGTATCTTAALAVASSDTVTGTYSGDSNHSGGSGSVNQEVDAATSTTTVTSTPNPSVYATSVTFTATINGANGLVKGRKPGKNGMKPMDPTGTVSWSANTGCAPSTVSGNPGVAMCTTSSATHLPVGTDPVTATYSGDGNHSGSSGSVNQVVQGGIATTIDVTGVSPSNEDFGANTAVTITALLSWTGHGTAPTAADVTIGGNGNGTYGATSCLPRSGETITCTATYTPSNADVAGVYTETASFSGDTNYAASSSPETGNFTINQASASVSIGTSLNPSTYGQAVTFTATITGENNEVKGRKPARKNGIKPMDVTGSVTWSVGGNPIPDCGTDGTTPVTSGNPGVATCTTSSLGGGTDTITATYSGDSNHGGAVGTLSGQVVNPASQAIALSSVPANAVYNTSFTVVASASSGLPVAFSSGGACSNSGATYTMTSGTGKCTVIVDQAGNANYAAAPEVTASLFAVKASQIITVTEPAPASAPKGTVFTVAAVSNEGLPITYANQNDGECTNSGPTFTLVAKGGTCFVSFNAAANSNYASASVAEQTVIQAAVKPTVSFTGAPASAFYQSTFTVSVTSNSTSTPTITAAGACTVSGTTVTMKLGTGTCTLTAKWAANPQYLAASATQTTTAEKLTSVVTWATPAPITYGTKLSPTQLNATANVAGNFAYTPKSGTKPAVPTPPATCDTLSVTFTPALVSDYTKETATVCLVVNPAP